MKAVFMQLFEMPYENPPVVEVALTFHYKPSDQTPAWSRESGLDFVGTIDGFSKPNFVYQQSFQVLSDIKTGTARTNIPQSILKEVNVRDEEGTGILGVGRSFLTYHKIRKGNDCPRYSPVAEQIFRYKSDYEEFWQTQGIHYITLLYFDIIRIPESRIEFDAYFNFGIKNSGMFGDMGQFETHLVFPPQENCGSVGLDVNFSKIPSSHQENESIFQIAWNYAMQVCDDSDVRNDTQMIHQFAQNCFEKGLTDECKKLFNPITC